jgi:hypothetical protein
LHLSSSKEIVFIDIDKHLLFIHNPKACGCTVRAHLKKYSKTYMDFMGYQSGFSAFAPSNDVAHIPIVNASQIAGIDPERYYKFGVVRDPIDRFRSAWKWFFKQELAPGINEFSQHLDRQHTLLQSYFFCDSDGEVLMDEIIKYEDFELKFNSLLSRFLLPSCSNVDNSSDWPEDEPDLTPENIDRLREIYADDYVRFGYK